MTTEEDHGGRAVVSVTMDDHPIMSATLAEIALRGRVNGGNFLPFTYRDPFDPEAPYELRPRRRAVLVVVELGTDDTEE